MTKLFSTPIDPRVMLRSLPKAWTVAAAALSFTLLGFTLRDKTNELDALPARVSVTETEIEQLKAEASKTAEYVEAIARGSCLDNRDQAIRAGLPCSALGVTP